MRIAHICASCGLDLTRAPAPVDPVYGLPIVVCPGCGGAVVRRKHPTMAWARWTGRLAAVLALVAVRGGGTLAAAGIVVGMSDVMHGIVRASGKGIDEARLVAALVWLAAALAAGVWVGFWFAHWRKWTLGAVWLGLLLGIWLLPAVMTGMEIVLDDLHKPWPVIVDELNWRLRPLARGPAVLLCAWVVSLAGVTAGWYAGAVCARWVRRKMWRRARARRERRWTSRLLSAG